jgi:hypothetical protein
MPRSGVPGRTPLLSGIKREVVCKVLQCLGFTDKTISDNLISGHCNMYRNTRFGELLNALPENNFRQCVEQHQSDKYNKGFDSWNHLVSMIYAQLSGSRSLRELEVSYNSLAAHHYHLGCESIKRSPCPMPIPNGMLRYLSHSVTGF